MLEPRAHGHDRQGFYPLVNRPLRGEDKDDQVDEECGGPLEAALEAGAWRCRCGPLEQVANGSAQKGYPDEEVPHHQIGTGTRAELRPYRQLRLALTIRTMAPSMTKTAVSTILFHDPAGS